MVKKIKKYVKFIVCCTLIMSLVAPSYAALSASDGSAFVTKAEFDSALADFNARLTTFEAGINSKIDSQVTSYLDRNGIWNGKAQVLTGEECIDYNNRDISGAPVAWREQTWKEFVMGSAHLTDGLTKSGLAMVHCVRPINAPVSFNSLYWNPTSSDPRMGCSTNFGLNSISYQMLFLKTSSNSATPDKTKLYCSTSLKFDTLMVPNNSANGKGCTAPRWNFPQENDFYTFFFVQKGDPLTVCTTICAYLYPWQDGTRDMETYQPTVSGSGKYKFEVSVY